VADWKKILVEGDAVTDNLATADLTQTSSTNRIFDLNGDNQTLSFKGGKTQIVDSGNGQEFSFDTVSRVFDVHNGNSIRFREDNDNNYIALKAATTVGSDYTITLPASAPGGDSKILESDSGGNLSWITTPSGSGSVSIDNYSAQGEMLVAGDSSSNIDAESNVTFSSSTLTVTGRIVGTDFITLSTNNRALKGKTTTAAVRDLIKINTDDSTVLGNTSEKTILSGTSVDAGSLQFNCGQATMDQIIETNISLNHSSTSAGHGDGSMVTYFDTSGSNNTTSGRVYYYTGTAWAFATSSAEAGNKALVGVALGDTEASGFLLRGFVNAGTTMTAGSPCFLSANASITTTAPTSGFSRIMGHSVTTTVMYFNPSAEYLDLV
jgi:hypothetical protein